MSGSGSPADRTGVEDTNTNLDTPASASGDVAADASGSGDANLSADASSASGEKKPDAKDAPKPTLADVVKTAAEANGEGKSSTPANDGKDKPEGTPDPAKAEAPHDPKDDEKLPFHNHPRWKQVIGENADFRKQIETLAPQAEQYEKIQSFMDQHHLSHDEVGELFVVGAMAKAGDPRALQRIDEFRDRLATAIGEKLPQDIQDRVDSGEITEAAGKELSRLRAKDAKATADADRNRQQSDEDRQRQAASDHAAACQAATVRWETEARKTDPDFAKKENAIARYSRAFVQERGFPKTVDEAVQIVKDAYAEVNKDLGAIIPAKKPVSHVPSTPSSHGAKTKPKNLLEAVTQAAAQ